MPVAHHENTAWDGFCCPNPNCCSRRTVVQWVRHRGGGSKRARVCPKCGRRIVTMERITNVVNSTAATSKPYMRSGTCF